MIRLLISFVLLRMPVTAYGQGNYIRTYRTRLPVGNGATLSASNSVVSTTYYDAAGRPVHTVRHGATPSGQDMADYTAYDAFGKKSQVWDFVPSGSGGGFKALGTLQSRTPYHHVDFKYDALGRPTCVTGANTPGASASYTYGYAPSGISRYTWDGGANAVNNAGPYTGALYSEKATDEDGGVLWVFRDSEGRTLLERRGSAGSPTKEWLDTYFVYDAFGCLACVLPPAASQATAARGTYSCAGSKALRDYAYLYRYDDRNNRTGCKLPGQDWNYTVYDGEGRPILVQDPNLRAGGAVEVHALQRPWAAYGWRAWWRTHSPWPPLSARSGTPASVTPIPARGWATAVLVCIPSLF